MFKKLPQHQTKYEKAADFFILFNLIYAIDTIRFSLCTEDMKELNKSIFEQSIEALEEVLNHDFYAQEHSLDIMNRIANSIKSYAKESDATLEEVYLGLCCALSVSDKRLKGYKNKSKDFFFWESVRKIYHPLRFTFQASIEQRGGEILDAFREALEGGKV